jgi:hypothetical protein
MNSPAIISGWAQGTDVYRPGLEIVYSHKQSVRNKGRMVAIGSVSLDATTQ